MGSRFKCVVLGHNSERRQMKQELLFTFVENASRGDTYVPSVFDTTPVTFECDGETVTLGNYTLQSCVRVVRAHYSKNLVCAYYAFEEVVSVGVGERV